MRRVVFDFFAVNTPAECGNAFDRPTQNFSSRSAFPSGYPSVIEHQENRNDDKRKVN